MAQNYDEMYAKLKYESARTDILEWMNETIELHEKTISELKAHRQRFQETKPTGFLTKPVDVFSWFVNAVQNGAARNVRFDLVAKYSHDLGVGEEMQRQLDARKGE